MDNIRKQNILLNCNSLDTNALVNLIYGGEITIDEFIKAGLSSSKIEEVKQTVQEEEKKRRAEGDTLKRNELKKEQLDKIARGKVGAEKIKELLNSRAITFDDLEDEGLSKTLVNSLKHFCSTDRIRKPKTVDELPPMQEGRTDVYFIGVAGSGKSTMLAGLLKTAHMLGISLPDPLAGKEGAVYQAELIQDLNKGVLPQGTQQGTYNYVALSLKDQRGKNHPFNIVDVPGENYRNMFQNAEVEALLRYIKNSNKKILIFVIDSLAHDNGYNDSKNQLDQSIAYVNILQMFKSNGILEETDAIYLIANKYDAIKERRYPLDDRKKGDLAMDYLSEEFLSLIENCKSAREECKNHFPIKVMPFSIGNISHDYILNSFDREFSNTLINQLLRDSFVITGGASKVFN